MRELASHDWKMSMKFVASWLALWLPLVSGLAHAQVKDRTLQLDLQAHVEAEAEERLRFPLSDLQPTGIYVKRGETLHMEVGAFSAKHHLSARIGFHPVWDDRNPSQEMVLVPGHNTLQATASGPLYFVHHNHQGLRTGADKLTVRVSGGNDIPLFELGKTDARQWHAQVLARKGSPYVELVSDRVIITLPARDHVKNPIEDPKQTFDTIHRVLSAAERLAGFDGSAPIHTLGGNRYHFLVDEWAQPDDGFYMYATSFHLGLLPESVADLVHPQRLKTQWGAWHEIGHTHQQQPWTWEDVVEVTVNLFSLKVQADFGRPSRLHDREYGADGRRSQHSSYALAARYLARKDKRYSELDDPFVKLVMFDQLRQALGWDFYTQLFKAFRERYQSPDLKAKAEDMSDAEKINEFVWMSSQVAQTNMLPFFEHWGLKPDQATVARIQSQAWPPASLEMAQWFGQSSQRAEPSARAPTRTARMPTLSQK